MNKDQDFGELLRSAAFVKDTVSAICKNKTNDLEKAVSIYNYVQNRMKWNGEYRKWALKGLKKPFAEGVGNSSEINLLLTLMLQTAGLNADPVLFSTRDNGIVLAFYPTIDKFNSVLSRVVINGKPVLLDAVSKYCLFGLLPPTDINGKGRVVNKFSGDWADLTTTEKYNEAKQYTLDISPDGKLTGSITGTYNGYAGLVYRYSLTNAKSPDEYVRNLQEGIKGLTVSKYSFSDKNDNYKPFTDTLMVEINDQTEMIGGKLLFNPLL